MPPQSPEDTIAAIATPPGGAMRAILRISGPDVLACLQRCCSFAPTISLQGMNRPAVVRCSMALKDYDCMLPCDVYFWPGQRSYTRQPVAELHTIGSPPLANAALRSVCAAGARLADPGEFTLRAFLAGRLDLPQAEAVLGVIDAASQRELQVALGQLAGGLSQPLNQLRDRLLDLLAELEAGLDFVEEDIQFIAPETLQRQLREAHRAAGGLLEQMSRRTIASGIPRVVLFGSPNVGKSSLLNALLSQSAALVADAPGTTRDYLNRWIELDGLACELVDTAGVGESLPLDGISTAAGEMTRQQYDRAQLRVFCLDATRPLNAWERAQLETGGGDRLLVVTKTDAPRRIDLHQPAIETSSHAGDGICELRREIVHRLSPDSSAEGSVVAETATRCRDSLRLARTSMRRAFGLAASGQGEELIAAEIRIALEMLGRVAGAVYTDDVLDRIFSRFCIGK